MADIDIEKMKQFYIKYNEKVNDNIKNLGLCLLRDYDNPETIKRMMEFCNLYHYYDQPFIFCRSNISYIDALANLLDKIDDDAISEFFIRAYNEAKIRYIDDLEVSESTAKIYRIGDNVEYQIYLPNSNRNSNLSYAILTHELTHYLLTLNKRPIDAYEYSEVLSMYFEYLMYNESSANGYPYFINNRLVLLDSNCEDLKQDLNYVSNPQHLGIDKRQYHGSLSANNCYLESLEYVLNLIARENYQAEVNGSISRIIRGENNCVEEAKKLDIDTSSYKQLKKVIKK